MAMPPSGPTALLRMAAVAAASLTFGGGVVALFRYGCLPRLAGAPLAIRSRFSAMLHYYTPEYEFVLE